MRIHASEHLWELGRALYPEEEVPKWVESRLHELRHGEEEKFLAHLQRLKPRRGEAGRTCSGKQGCFKRRGQFWTHLGFGYLEALIEARQNNHWDELWFAT